MEISTTELHKQGRQVWTFGKASHVYGKERVKELYEREHKAGRLVKVYLKADESGEPMILYAGLFASEVNKYISETAAPRFREGATK